MATVYEIQLRRLDGSTGQAAVVGNNASWACLCDRDSPLLASLQIAAGSVSCPTCNRHYQVIGQETDDGRNLPARVEERQEAL